jgi:hypothetical protein
MPLLLLLPWLAAWLVARLAAQLHGTMRGDIAACSEADWKHAILFKQQERVLSKGMRSKTSRQSLAGVQHLGSRSPAGCAQ